MSDTNNDYMEIYDSLHRIIIEKDKEIVRLNEVIRGHIDFVQIISTFDFYRENRYICELINEQSHIVISFEPGLTRSFICLLGKPYNVTYKFEAPAVPPLLSEPTESAKVTYRNTQLCINAWMDIVKNCIEYIAKREALTTRCVISKSSQTLYDASVIKEIIPSKPHERYIPYSNAKMHIKPSDGPVHEVHFHHREIS